MNTIREAIAAAVAGVIFTVAVSLLLYASKVKNRLGASVYDRSRYERLLPDTDGPDRRNMN